MVGYDYMKAHRESFVKFLFVWLLITCVCMTACLVPIGIAANFYLRGQGTKNGGSAQDGLGDKNFDFDAVPDVSS